VIEILSASNRAAEIFEKEKLCLENGAKEFWVVDSDRRQVKVSTPDGHTLTYTSGQEIPLPLFGTASWRSMTFFAERADSRSPPSRSFICFPAGHLHDHRPALAPLGGYYRRRTQQ
jgi:hypothetical protein